LSRQRLLILLCAFLAAGGILIARLAQMQIGWRGRLEGGSPAGGSGGELLDGPRGAIYTSDGVLLARDVHVFGLAVHYSHLRAAQVVARAEPVLRAVEAYAGLEGSGTGLLRGADWRQRVSRLTGTSVGELDLKAADVVARVERIWRAVRERTGRRDLRIVEQDQFHPVVDEVSPEVAVFVRTEPDRFPGLKVTHRAQRVYFNGDLAPHVVGRCGALSPERWEQLVESGRAWNASMPVSEAGGLYCKEDVAGTTGVELSYEGLLCGRRGYVERYLLFHPLRVERRAITVPPESGQDIYLTLRADFQRAANDALRWAALQSAQDFSAGALVILDVRTGGVLAAATYPSYDLETFRADFERLSVDPGSPLLFRPTQAALMTGSVYKLMTAVAALEDGKITASTTFACAGGVRFQDRWFSCTATHGAVDLLPGIEESCNSYFFQVAALLDGASMARWGRAFGLGVRTGVDLPFEKAGRIPEPGSLFGRLNLAIGQGEMLCTPLQVARMCAAFANGGRLVQPHFMERVVGPGGQVARQFEPRTEAVRVSPETLRLLREGMHRTVVGRKGTARLAGLGPFDAAGKTGTAELGGGRPNHAWFAGFAPYENPKIAFAVVSERTTGHGGSHAAPIMAKALEPIWPQVERMP
jgi:penicillin-binding protein 2